MEEKIRGRERIIGGKKKNIGGVTYGQRKEKNRRLEEVPKPLNV
jgi:hypothetical protein